MFDTAIMVVPRLSISELASATNVAPVVLARELIVPIPQVFHEVLPGGGLQRGWSTSVGGSPAARVFAWALLGEVTRSGGWVAAVDLSGISLAAANEVGLSIERVLVVSGADSGNWATTIGALVGAVDVIVYGFPRRRIQPSVFRKLISRCRERGTVLMALPESYVAQLNPSPPVEVDISFDVRPTSWLGLGEGHGHLKSRAIDVTVSGRRVPGQQRRGTFMVPDTDGVVRSVSTSSGSPLSIVG